MELDFDSEPAARAPAKRGVFNWEINLGHVFIVLSLLLGGAGLYANQQRSEGSFESRLSNLESRANAADEQNLPPRVSALEAQMPVLIDGMKTLHEDLTGIRNSLDNKADKNK